MKAKLTIFAVFLLFGGILAAQSGVEIKDLIFRPVNIIDSTSNDLTFEIMFKMNNAANAEHVVVLFGTAQEIGDVLTLQADIFEESGMYYVLFNGDEELISGYETKFYVSLAQPQFSSFSVMTVYIEDTNGNFSNKLFFVKQ